MPKASIIVPSYNVQDTLSDTLSALLDQTFQDFEIIVVNDGSSDDTCAIAERFTTDPRVRIETQRNRGLAGARNTGIARARGAYIGFCDADDIWEPSKLATHVAHLDANPQVGVSFSGSALIDDAGDFLGTAQRPHLTGITAQHVLKRNPVGNGSAPVIRRAVFEELAFRPDGETERDWYFDETFRQSEDIECWVRIALTTQWRFEGVPGLLTRYRISQGALSANTARQLATWEQMARKVETMAPAFPRTHIDAARAYQLRYLARRAVCDRDAARAARLMRNSLAVSLTPLFEEPTKTVTTLAAVALLRLGGALVLDLALGGGKTNA